MVFCLVDDEIQALNLPRLRTRGPQLTLTDNKVITLELVGELWSSDPFSGPDSWLWPTQVWRSPPAVEVMIVDKTLG